MLEQKQRDGEKGEVESQELLGWNPERVRVQVWHSALLTLFFTFSVNFLPSAFSLDLTDSVIPSQAWILGPGAPRVAVSGPAAHMVAIVRLLVCVSLGAVCSVRAGPGRPPPQPPGLQLLEPGAERVLTQPVLCVCERPAPSTPLAPLGRVPAAWVVGHRRS